MSRKTNPRNIPVSMADVQRALVQGRVQGGEFGVIALLYALVDKCGADKELIHNANKALDYVLDSIARGYINYSDLRDILKQEYSVEVHFN